MTLSPLGESPASVRRRYGLGDLRLIDFSTTLNPIGPPESALAAARSALDEVSESPEAGCPRLVERLAELHSVPVDRVIVGGGTSELIGLIGQSLREVLALHAYQRGDPAMAVSHLVEPTDRSYRRASALNELRIESWGGHVLGWEQEVFPTSAAGIFWTGNPNDPTGRVWDREKLLRLVDESLGLLTVVDESALPFMVDEPERSLVKEVASRENVLVLRAPSVFFALPGLPIGYAIASADMVIRLRQYQDPWTVSQPAEAATLAALDDNAYRERTVRLIADESTRLEERLWEIPGLRPTWPERTRLTGAPKLPSFLLASLTETPWTSTQVHEALARRGFLVRECSDYTGLEVGALITGPDQLVATQGHLRIGVRTPEENDALISAFADVLGSEPPR
ncbi:pyridoxal phosphate-dependent aminotransferase [Singulisphaera rosea]